MNVDPVQNIAASLQPNFPANRGYVAPAQPSASEPVGPAVAPPPVAATPKLTSEKLSEQEHQALAESNSKLQSANVSLQFQFNIDKSGVRSVSLTDSNTHEVVMQFPSEAMLEIRDQIDKMIQANEKGGSNAGALFSKSA